MSIDRLRAHYGFTRMPFGKDLAPGMLHAHGAHAEAVARISWCISEQAIGVISGECGAGKTVAARAAVAALDASRHTVLYLGTPGVGLRGIYTTIITGLGGTPRFHHAALIPQAQELLAAEASERGKQVLLICDEAHLLDAECLEGIRCLSNMGMDQTAPFCLLLLGQPALRHRLRRGAFTALDQRVGMRYAIAGLDVPVRLFGCRRHAERAGILPLNVAFHDVAPDGPELRFGEVAAEYGRIALDSIDAAVTSIERGECAALVTAAMMAMALATALFARTRAPHEAVVEVEAVDVDVRFHGCVRIPYTDRPLSTSRENVRF